ncbi:MAG: DUF1573 domain-containing protein [Bacteroidota bacterium]
MKYLASLLSLVVFIVVSYGQDKSELQDETESLTGPKIYFTEISFDFGDISQGDKVEHVFEFENTGNEPLILSDVRTTCGCTAPEWPREPIVPGTKAKLKVRFNSTGKMGVQNKVITVMSNAVNSPARVKIITNVLPKESGGRSY